MKKYELPDLSKLTADDLEGNTPLQEYIAKQLLMVLTQKENIHGRRIGKAKDAVTPGDYVTKRQLNGTLVGTLAQRPQPANVVQGTTYFATDRNVTYIMRGGHWYYYSGIQNVTLSPNTKPSPSVLYDNGYMIYATDVDWYYRWNLVTWERLGGANLFIQGFYTAPTKAGWGLLDGSTYTYSTDSGGTASFAFPDIRTKFLKYGATTTFVSAVTPTISGITGNQNANHFHNVTATGTVTGKLPDHTHGISFVTGSGNLSLTGSVDNSVTVTMGNANSCTLIQDGSEDSHSMADCGHSHTASGTLDNPNVGFGNEDHTHAVEGSTAGVNEGEIDLVDLTFTGNAVSTTTESANHQHSGTSLNISGDGAPAAVQLIPYIRL